MGPSATASFFWALGRIAVRDPGNEGSESARFATANTDNRCSFIEAIVNHAITPDDWMLNNKREIYISCKKQGAQ